MTSGSRLLLVLATLAPALAGCPADAADPTTFRTSCPADDPRVGRTAVLSGYYHGVQGTARIVDNCTIVIEHFSYDAGGLDVCVAGVKGNDLAHAVPLTGNIRSHGPYRNETLTIPLPQGVTLGDVERIAILCVSYGINFGDGVFE